MPSSWSYSRLQCTFMVTGCISTPPIYLSLPFCMPCTPLLLLPCTPPPLSPPIHLFSLLPATADEAYRAWAFSKQWLAIGRPFMSLRRPWTTSSFLTKGQTVQASSAIWRRKWRWWVVSNRGGRTLGSLFALLSLAEVTSQLCSWQLLNSLLLFLQAAWDSWLPASFPIEFSYWK